MHRVTIAIHGQCTAAAFGGGIAVPYRSAPTDR